MKKGKEKINLKGLWLDVYESMFDELGEKRYRARQLAQWIYARRATDFSQMSDFSKDLRDRLNQIAYIENIRMVKTQTSQKDISEKFLFELKDKEKVESVLMLDGKRVTACLSTQAGCPLGCTFCATGKMGFKRNLTAGEIVDQALAMTAFKPATHAVLMGIGEPLMNYDNTLQAMKHPLDKLMKSAKVFNKKTNRRVTFEYVLMKDVNDSEKDALALSKLITGIRCKINLIPYNPVPDLPYERPSEEKIAAFRDYLYPRCPAVTLRRSKGEDILAACGQLRTQS
jgi:23S rRNA (adenine2503-C2)-methyltransferase